MLRLLVDDQIPFAQQAFAEFGEVRLVPGRAITRAMLRDVDLLLVRSVTPVNAALLDGTSVRFVGTATTGVDHVDADYLRRRGIGYASAAGSNANSVAEYVVAAILQYVCEKQLRFADLTIGIVGVGKVGSRVIRFAQALGLHVLENDPPRQRAESSATFLPLDQLMQADIISLHTPLTMTGEDATLHLFDAQRLPQMKSGSLLINTARGGVVETAALQDALARGQLTAYLDVWENEPEIDGELLKHVGLGTPHIAGYSYDGKTNGTHQIYEGLCQFLDRRPHWQPEELPRPGQTTIGIEKPSTLEENLRQAVSTAYDIVADSQRLKLATPYSRQERGRYFDELRANYPIRREFSSYKIVANDLDEGVTAILRALGFNIQNE